ncbi:MAG: MarR family winged helix-turn-helix transcriptional regulator [Paraclostridium sordellii]|uniref:MarR family winged helix-turn-helix transcriptional regulator n=1 Tax=Paraclostridium sordellii TaxID=1505 RepID=UPI0005425733|nr:MarR family transcriptional regulator [Paeniclostridium sordellii]MCR1848914.1 MarR family transcriptional regulator [Paeniclostridium sordellii]CEK35210.1 MarR family transcriptional regulator,Multiple antibiotic resistance protein marR,DNA-binding transcriptional repressor MarR,Predicted transcriptional regulator,homoprotocatechuate degradation operon regulator, HpaR,MarR family [[Clostridium] sordellii] [Paeniclostridium sordellii]CEP90300.1 MarR family transcriptional regulator [[Clostrid
MEIIDTLNLIRSTSLLRKNYANFVNKSLSNSDITLSEFAYLKEVVNCDGIAQDELIRNLSIDKAAATRIAQSLEKKEIIQRIRNENNKRFFNVFLTDKGHEYADFIKQTLSDFYNVLNNEVSSSDMKTFMTIFKKINSNFEE